MGEKGNLKDFHEILTPIFSTFFFKVICRPEFLKIFGVFRLV
jgi:hypothetical protein